ncbi:MAG: LysR family transcriptional regulator, partial [Rhodoferax sp.]
TGSVTGAGHLLALSQPATSHLLAKLRDSFGDELFIRTPKGLKPTPLCERLAPAIQAQLAELESTLTEDQPFDPGLQPIDWRVSLSDLGEMMFLPALASLLRQQAPLATIANVSVTAQDVSSALDARDIDFAIGILHSQHKNIHQEALFEENYVAVSSGDWRPGGKTPRRQLNLQQVENARFVIASPTATFQTGVEKLLYEHQLSRQVVLRARHFGAIPELISHTDVLAIVPRMYAQSLASRLGFQIWELPMSTLNYTVNLLWHNSTNHDGAHLWMRQQIRRLFSSHEKPLPESRHSAKAI